MCWNFVFSNDLYATIVRLSLTMAGRVNVYNETYNEIRPREKGGEKKKQDSRGTHLYRVQTEMKEKEIKRGKM